MKPRFLAKKGNEKIFCDALVDALHFYLNGYQVEDLINGIEFTIENYRKGRYNEI